MQLQKSAAIQDAETTKKRQEELVKKTEIFQKLLQKQIEEEKRRKKPVSLLEEFLQESTAERNMLVEEFMQEWCNRATSTSTATAAGPPIAPWRESKLADAAGRDPRSARPVAAGGKAKSSPRTGPPERQAG